MAKKKKRLRAKARQKMNTDGILAGLIPWSLEGFQETLKWHITLCLQIPVREWRQIDKGFHLRDDQTGEIQIFKFNQESPMFQLIE